MGRTGTYIALAVMVLVGVFGGLASWASSGNAMRPVEIAYDRFVTNLTGSDPFTRCFRRTGEFGNLRTFVTEVKIDDLDCYLPPAVFEGALVVEPEGYVFVASLGPQSTYSISCNPIWWYAIDGIRQRFP